MTLVMGRRFNDRLVILSDSMITHKAATKPNAIPGRLKSIILSRDMAVSYAGLANKALSIIRALLPMAYKGVDLEAMLSTLQSIQAQSALPTTKVE